MNKRFVPVLLDESNAQHIPLELRKYNRFSVNTGEGYENLYRLLTDQPRVKEPILGKALNLPKPKPDFRNFAWNAPSRNPFFTGRATHLEGIRQALTQTSQPQAISGLGGIGKTQTAIEYAHVYRAQYQAVLWSGGEDRNACFPVLPLLRIS